MAEICISAVACGMQYTVSGRMLMVSHISWWSGLINNRNVLVLSNSIASSKEVGCLGKDWARRALDVVEFIKRFQKMGCP